MGTAFSGDFGRPESGWAASDDGSILSRAQECKEWVELKPSTESRSRRIN